MAMTDTVLRATSDGVLTITLNRPEALNSFTVEMKEALLAALKDAARDKEVRAIVLTGAGRAFSAGQDLKERSAPGVADLGTELRLRYNPIIFAMRRLEKPIIGAINGVAAGAGISIALACDIVIAAENASFIEAFVRVGLVPDTGSTWFLPRLAGAARAGEMMFTGDPVDATTAERIGLINRVVPADQVDGRGERPRGAPREVRSHRFGPCKARHQPRPGGRTRRVAGVRGAAPDDRRPVEGPRRGRSRVRRETSAAVPR